MQDDAGWNGSLGEVLASVGSVMLTGAGRRMLAVVGRMMLAIMWRMMQAGIGISGQCWFLWTG